MAIAESPLPLMAGDKLTLDEFLERWEAMPRLKRAELIGGVVYMPSPVSPDHGSADSFVGVWIGTYAVYTPGCCALDNTTTRIFKDAPQPDVQLRLRPEVGGQAQDEEGVASGPPELAAEVCVSRSSYDLNQKYDLYEAAGVPEYVAVLMHEKEVRWHQLVKGSYQRMPQPQDGVLRSVVFPGLWLNVQALLAGHGAQLLATLHQGLQSPEHAAFVAELTRRRATAAGQ
jgi:Uma2 family endonuclease